MGEWRNCRRVHTQDPSTEQRCLQVNVKRTEKEQQDYERGLSVEISVPCVCVGLTDGQRIMQSFVGFKARQSPLPSSDSSQFPSTCSSLPLVFGCSNVAC